MESLFEESLKKLAEDHNKQFLPGSQLNKKLKLLSFYLIQLLKNPQNRISIHNPIYQQYSDQNFHQTLQSLGFSLSQQQWIYTGNIQQLAQKKQKLLQSLHNYRYFSLAQVSQYIQKGQNPPLIQTIDDSPIEGPITEPKLARRRKPWEQQMAELSEQELTQKIVTLLKEGEDPKQIIMSWCKPQCQNDQVRLSRCQEALKNFNGADPDKNCLYRYRQWFECVENCVQPKIFYHLNSAHDKGQLDGVFNIIWAMRYLFAPLYPIVRIAIGFKRVNVIEGQPVE